MHRAIRHLPFAVAVVIGALSVAHAAPQAGGGPPAAAHSAGERKYNELREKFNASYTARDAPSVIRYGVDLEARLIEALRSAFTAGDHEAMAELAGALAATAQRMHRAQTSAW